MAEWQLSHRAEPAAVAIADRHYNRQKIGTPQFVPPGRCLVLRRDDALWVTSWPFAEYVKHAWAGAWVNSLFRNEGTERSSDLIRAAVAATLAMWEAPPLGMVTFVDAAKIKNGKQPGRQIGRCYLKAGFEPVGMTAGGLFAFRLPIDRMPLPHEAIGMQLPLAGSWRRMTPRSERDEVGK